MKLYYKVLTKMKIYSGQDFIDAVLQFIKFGMVGALNTVLSLAIYWLFIYINPAWYYFGQTVAFIVTVINAYFLNSKFVFNRKTGGHIRAICKTYAGYGFTYILTLILLYLQVDVAGISKVIAPVISLLVTIPLNYLINKFWALK